MPRAVQRVKAEAQIAPGARKGRRADMSIASAPSGAAARFGVCICTFALSQIPHRQRAMRTKMPAKRVGHDVSLAREGEEST